MDHSRLHSPQEAARWLRERGARRLVTHHQAVQPGDAWLAWPGARQDPRSHVDAAIRAGAVACLLEAQGWSGHTSGAPASQTCATLEGLKACAGTVASLFLGEPSQQLQVAAVTGTNGKTSTAWWLAQAWAQLGQPCGLVGTLGMQWISPSDSASTSSLAAATPTGLTTPDAVALQTQWREWADAGARHVVMEASSIGLEEHRLMGTQVDMALFTNLTRDHLDYHGTMDRYWAAKRRLFEGPVKAAGVNIDDPHGAALAHDLRHRSLDLWTVSTGGPGTTQARLRACDIVPSQGGTQFWVHEEAPSASSVQAWAPVVGTFNVNNLLLVVAALRHGGVPLHQAVQCLAACPAVPGRLQRVGPPSLASSAPPGPRAQGPHVFVDYAHTPDALEKVLRTLQPLAQAQGGQLWCVFGCGGQRDRGKRPLMTAVASSLAQRLVLTSDNPRNESAADIIDDMVKGFTSHHGSEFRRIEDRGEAIAWAIAQAREQDVVLIAGKGHETTQEVAGVRHPFSDAEVAERAWRARG